MTLAEVNWKNFLEPGSEQPPDVFFSILEEEQQTTEEVSEQDGAKAVFTFGPPCDESLNGAPAPKKRRSDSSPEKEPTSSTSTSSGTDPVFRPNVVAAHKFLLAGASQVFRRQFLGSLKENSNVVVIKETTFEAFSTMVNYLYNPPGKSFSLSHLTCPQVLCEIYNIAERYGLENLKLIVYAVLSALPITSENLLLAAATAKQW